MKNVFNFILALILLAFLGYIGFVAIFFIFDVFGKLNQGLQAALASAMALITVAGISFFANKTIEQKKSIELSIRPRKLELYEEFVSFFLKVLGQGKVYPAPTKKDIMKFFADSNPLIMTFASNAVIEKWGKLRLRMAGGDGIQNMFELEDFLKEIRKDLGHPKRGSNRGDILRLVVNDIDDYLKKK
ncbi:MAG TPA: hypothetical protein VGE30_00065 [Candidatus Saccharimonadales bacterium]